MKKLPDHHLRGGFSRSNMLAVLYFSVELRDEPAVIDPSLAVDARRVPYSQWSASYWPRYAGLTPLDRALYLQWLATGRCDPAAPIGLCFLYLYGIERYLLVDAAEAESSRSEVPRLIAELDRGGGAITALSYFGE